MDLVTFDDQSYSSVRAEVVYQPPKSYPDLTGSAGLEAGMP